jgi:hypothetical protein
VRRRRQAWPPPPPPPNTAGPPPPTCVGALLLRPALAPHPAGRPPRRPAGGRGSFGTSPARLTAVNDSGQPQPAAGRPPRRRQSSRGSPNAAVSRRRTCTCTCSWQTLAQAAGGGIDRGRAVGEGRLVWKKDVRALGAAGRTRERGQPRRAVGSGRRTRAPRRARAAAATSCSVWLRGARFEAGRAQSASGALRLRSHAAGGRRGVRRPPLKPGGPRSGSPGGPSGGRPWGTADVVSTVRAAAGALPAVRGGGQQRGGEAGAGVHEWGSGGGAPACSVAGQRAACSEAAARHEG